jgi:hypothetical protein
MAVYGEEHDIEVIFTTGVTEAETDILQMS